MPKFYVMDHGCYRASAQNVRDVRELAFVRRNRNEMTVGERGVW